MDHRLINTQIHIGTEEQAIQIQRQQGIPTTVCSPPAIALGHEEQGIQVHRQQVFPPVQIPVRPIPVCPELQSIQIQRQEQYPPKVSSPQIFVGGEGQLIPMQGQEGYNLTVSSQQMPFQYGNMVMNPNMYHNMYLMNSQSNIQMSNISPLQFSRNQLVQSYNHNTSLKKCN